MADGLNRACLLGNLGMDPDLKYTQGGQAVLRLRLATAQSWIDRGGQRQERTEWHTVVIWGKRAEGLKKVLAKGARVYIEGSIQTRSWDARQTGEKRYATEIAATNVVLCGSPSRYEPGSSAARPGGSKPAQGGGEDYHASDDGFDGSSAADDDIHF